MTTTKTSGSLDGRSLIGTTKAQDSPTTFRALNPATGEALEPAFHVATVAQIERAGEVAMEAFAEYSARTGPERAEFLRAIAAGLEGNREELVARAHLESALPEGRLDGEVTRTANQLRMFADLIEGDEWLDARHDEGDPEREAAPKPDVRSFRRALGPVAVFGASNFPFAFSVAGGDTASALAAGCPVIVKAHPGHPGTSELVGKVILAAARETGMPDGTFSLLFDDGIDVGVKLVQLPQVRAVGFTGSRGAGEALMRTAAARPVPIPVYAEMGSVNPVFVLPQAAVARAEQIATGLHGSFTLGVGQFCTNPGVVLVPNGEAGDALVAKLSELTRETPGQTMLNERVCSNYGRGLQGLREAGARELVRGEDAGGPTTAVAVAWEVGIKEVILNPELLSEVFGPSTLVVRYDEEGELLDFARSLEGQLTATLQGEPAELPNYRELVAILADRAGRLIVNQYPTGVEVGPAMVHGGPYPATSDGRSTSVGTHAIERFTRLVAYQNFPDELLPEQLR